MVKKLDKQKLMKVFKVQKKPSMSKMGKESEAPSKYDQTIKGRWIERNLSNLSKEFQDAWKITKEKKDKAGKQKLLSAVIKDGKGKRGFTITDDIDKLQETVSEIKKKGLSAFLCAAWARSSGRALPSHACSDAKLQRVDNTALAKDVDRALRLMPMPMM